MAIVGVHYCFAIWRCSPHPVTISWRNTLSCPYWSGEHCVLEWHMCTHYFGSPAILPPISISIPNLKTIEIHVLELSIQRYLGKLTFSWRHFSIRVLKLTTGIATVHFRHISVGPSAAGVIFFKTIGLIHGPHRRLIMKFPDFPWLYFQILPDISLNWNPVILKEGRPLKNCGPTLRRG